MSLPPLHRRLREPVLLAAAYGTVLIATCHTLTAFDTFWHLASGRHIVEHRAIPATDPFSYSAPDAPWINVQWGFDVLTFGLTEIGGLRALPVLGMGVFTATFLLVFGRAARHRRRILAAGLTFLALMASEERLLIRPEMISYLFVAVYSYIAARVIASGDRRWLYALPPFQIVWANMHSLAILGPILLGLLAAGTFLDGFRTGESRRTSALLVIATAACLLAGVVTPFGFDGLKLPFIQLLDRIGGGTVYAHVIGEFRPPWWGPVHQWNLAMRAFFVFCTVTAIALAVGYRRVRWMDVILLAAFGTLAGLARRNIPLFVIIATPIVTRLIAETLAGETCQANSIRRRIRFLELPVTLLLLAVLLVYVWATASGARYAYYPTFRRFGLGVSQVWLSRKAVEFFADQNLPRPIFNDIPLGGYLLWREQGPVLMDGRLEVYPKDVFVKNLGAHETWDHFVALADEYRFNTVLASHYALDEKIMQRLFNDRRWALVYFDAMAAIFVRDTPAYGPIIRAATNTFMSDSSVSSEAPLPGEPMRGFDDAKKYALHSQRAVFLKLIGNPGAAAAEYKRASLHAPMAQQYVAARVSQARMAADAGDLRGAEGAYRAALERMETLWRWPWATGRLTTDESVLLRSLGKVLVGQRRLDEAKEHFRAAVELTPDSGEAHNELASLYGTVGDMPRAVEHFERAVALDPDNTMFRNNLAKARSLLNAPR